jgi:hypothetical protein
VANLGCPWVQNTPVHPSQAEAAGGGAGGQGHQGGGAGGQGHQGGAGKTPHPAVHPGACAAHLACTGGHCLGLGFSTKHEIDNCTLNTQHHLFLTGQIAFLSRLKGLMLIAIQMLAVKKKPCRRHKTANIFFVTQAIASVACSTPHPSHPAGPPGTPIAKSQEKFRTILKKKAAGKSYRFVNKELFTADFS